jgi:hypothetical protein
MRDAELTQLKKDVENIAQETEASFRATEQTLQKSVDDVRQSVDASLETLKQPDAIAHDADGLPIAPPQPAEPAAIAGNGASEAQPSTSTPGETTAPSQVAAEPSRPVEKSGA